MTDKEFEQCMSAMAAGDRDSLRHIYDAYLKLIYAVVYDTIGQREEAEDVTSEFFIKLYSVAGSYKPGNGHKKWLVTIARNMAVDRIRKIDREALVDEIPETGRSGSMEEQVVNSVSLKVAMESLKPGRSRVTFFCIITFIRSHLHTVVLRSDMASFDFFHTGTVINSTMITAAATA